MPSPTPKYDAPKNKFLGAAQMLHFSNGLYFDLPQKNQGLAKNHFLVVKGRLYCQAIPPHKGDQVVSIIGVNGAVLHIYL